MSSMMPQPEVSAIVACTICRDVQHFDLLIEDMESALGDAWGDLGFAESLAFFGQPEAETLEFVALAIDGDDEDNLVMLTEIVTLARARGIDVILIAEDVTPPTLHTLMRQSNGDFVPYPLPEGELAEAIHRVRARKTEAMAPKPPAEPPIPSGSKPSNPGRNGAILAVHGLAGGTGATTLAVNLAWELADLAATASAKIALLDFDLQFGSVSTFLDLSRKEAVYEMLSETEAMDDVIFDQALQSFEDKISILTSPTDMLPLEMITPEDIERVLAMTRSQFDFVIIDMPKTLVHWTETVLTEADVYLCPLELDMRSAQNALRFKRALQSEQLPIEKLRYIMNRAPKFTDLTGKARVKRMAESLGISIDVHLPDGGKQITQACDHGQPLAISASKNPLRKEIARLAQQLDDIQKADAQAA